ASATTAPTCSAATTVRARPRTTTATLTTAGASMAAAARMATRRRVAGTRDLSAESGPTLVLRTSDLGAAWRLWRLLHSSGSLRPLFRQPALFPHRHPSRDVSGISAFLIRRIFVPAAGSIPGKLGA